jgi:hypothetical protein
VLRTSPDQVLSAETDGSGRRWLGVGRTELKVSVGGEGVRVWGLGIVVVYEYDEYLKEILHSA